MSSWDKLRAGLLIAAILLGPGLVEALADWLLGPDPIPW